MKPRLCTISIRGHRSCSTLYRVVPNETRLKPSYCVTLAPCSPLYKVIYRQRTESERINSQALGIERPKVRNGHSVRNLNTLTYLIINACALQKRNR